MDTIRSAALGLLVLCALPAAAAAQAPRPDLVGRTVRVWADGVVHEGVVTETQGTGLGITTADGSERFDWSAVERMAALEVRRQTGKTALGLGLGAGLLGGLLLEGWESCFLETECDDEFHAGRFLDGFVAVGAVGALVGALIGSQVERRSWEPVVVPARGTGSAWRVGVTLGLGRGARLR